MRRQSSFVIGHSVPEGLTSQAWRGLVYPNAWLLYLNDLPL